MHNSRDSFRQMPQDSESRFYYLVLGYHDRILTAEEFHELQDFLKQDEGKRSAFVALCIQIGQLQEHEKAFNDLAQPLDMSFVPGVYAEDTEEMVGRGRLSDVDVVRVQQIEMEANRKLHAFLATQERQRQAQKKAQETSIGIWQSLHQVARKTHTVCAFTWKASKRLGIAAAVLFSIFVGVQAYRMNRVVAVLDNQVHSQWLYKPDGNDLRPGLCLLEKGFAQIHFKRGADVLVQAPCEFELLTPNRMRLLSGLVTAKVPPEAYGFRIDTLEGAIVDLGTEFGVGIGHQLDVHVFKGKVSLNTHASGKRSAARQSLAAGQAATLNSGKRPTIGSLANQPALFTRELPDPNHLMGIPGVSINLADIVGGGNGYGTGFLDQGIDMDTGRVKPVLDYDFERTGPKYFVAVPGITAIDGVFIPDGGAGGVQINSTGQILTDCPDTSGFYWTQVANSAQMSTNKGMHLCSLQGVAYGTREHPSLLIHPNAGITFDLQEIRRYLPINTRIVAFRSLCGVSETVANYDPNPASYQSDFWVLVGDERRFVALGQTSESEPLHVNVELVPDDRFLTLMATDSDGNNDCDWCLFAGAVLVLERTD